MIREKITSLRVILAGESYWRARFTNGKWLSELDEKPVSINGQQYRVRRVEWLDDVIGSGDLKNLKEIALHTPKGTAHIYVQEPYTGFQFSRGTLGMLNGERIKNIQIIGAVIDKTTGACTSAIWDYQAQQLYVDRLWDGQSEKDGFNNVYHFQAWRDGIAAIGPLNLSVMDVRL